MAVRISDAAQDAMLNAVTGLVDAGAAAGMLRLYTGTQPADADTAPGGTLLAEFDLADPAFGAAAGGSTSMAGGAKQTTGVGTGTAGWGRLVDSDGNPVVDGAVGAEITIDNASIATGQTVTLDSMTLGVPAS